MTVLSANVARYHNAQFKYKICLQSACVRWTAETLLMYKIPFLMMNWFLFSKIPLKPAIEFRA